MHTFWVYKKEGCDNIGIFFTDDYWPDEKEYGSKINRVTKYEKLEIDPNNISNYSTIDTTKYKKRFFVQQILGKNIQK